MGKQNKVRLAIVAGVILLILLWLWLKRQPKYARLVEQVSKLVPNIPAITVPNINFGGFSFDFGSVTPWQETPDVNHTTNVVGGIEHLMIDPRNGGGFAAGSMPVIPESKDAGTCSLCTSTKTDESQTLQPVGNVAQITPVMPPQYLPLGAPPPLSSYPGGVGRRAVW